MKKNANDRILQFTLKARGLDAKVRTERQR